MPSQPNNPFSANDANGDHHSKDGGSEGGVKRSLNETSFECNTPTQGGVPKLHSTSGAKTSSFPPIQPEFGSYLAGTDYKHPSGPFGYIIDPRTKCAQRWSRMLLFARGFSVAVDPLFFYVIAFGGTVDEHRSIYLDYTFLTVVTVLRACIDVIHFWHIWLKFRTAYIFKESLVVGSGKLVWDPRAVVSNYARSLKGLWFDLLVILPILPVVCWLVLPKMIREGKIVPMLSTLLLVFLLQFIIKAYHCIYMVKKARMATGYVFGSIWWALIIAAITYILGSHVYGGCWYALALQRVTVCMKTKCPSTPYCDEISDCFDTDGSFLYGIYKYAIPVFTINSRSFRVAYPFYFGYCTLSTIGNVLEPTSNFVETLFSVIGVVGGLLLFTVTVAGIQIFLHAMLVRRKKVQLRRRDIEWWMKRRQLPMKLKKRVITFERQRWTALGVENDMDFIRDLPQGLRRDVKRHLCFDLINKVPLFNGMDDLILDNICDRVTPIVYSKDELIIQEGDPVQKMIFIMRGQAKRSQNLSRGVKGTSKVETGGYLGDELLSWCLRSKKLRDHLPLSSATFICTSNIEAYCLCSDDLMFLNDQFRNRFLNHRMKRTARYYSSNWRTWGAVVIQIAWRRHRRTTFAHPISAVPDGDRRMLQYAAMFMSIRPQDHLD